MNLLNVWPTWISERMAAGRHVQLELPPLEPRTSLHLPEFVEDTQLKVVDGVAIVQIIGFLQKHHDVFDRLFGAVSIGDIELQIRAAAADASVNQTLVIVDSPGGTQAGMSGLADAIFEHRTIKPITAFIDDMGASGGYYAASQAGTIIVDRDAIVGGIGAFVVLPDMSQAFKDEGIKVHVIKSGAMKGFDVPGVEVTTETLNDLDRFIHEMAAVFIADVARGRGNRLPISKVQVLADGRVYVGQRAVDLGLADSVAGLQDTIDMLRSASLGGASL